MTVIFLTTTGAGNWTVPDDWNDADNSVECIGGGGAAARGQFGVSFPAGGGGGGYSKEINLNLTPASSVPYNVGAAGALAGAINTNGGAGGDTWFGNAVYASATVGAKGGGGGTKGIPATGGVGGAAASGIGSTKSSGGNGGPTPAANASGGGGGAAGPNGNGGNGGSGALANNDGGGGGGGSGGGSNGGSTTGPTGGAGGNNFGGTGGGTTPGGNGSNGGGGAGGNSATKVSGGHGSTAPDWDSTHGPGGGGGGGGITSGTVADIGGNGGNYGGGAGAGSIDLQGGTPGQGIIVITYTPVPPDQESGETGETGEPIPEPEIGADILWPFDDLKPRHIGIYPCAAPIGGGIALTGKEATRDSGAGYWRFVLGGIPVKNRTNILIWRGLEAECEGRGRTFAIPLYDGKRAPWPGAPGGAIDAESVGDVLADAMSVEIQPIVMDDVEAGMHFSVADRAYRITSAELSSGVYSCTFWPKAREAWPAGMALEFRRPICRVRLARDDGMSLTLDGHKRGEATVEFVEAM